MKILVAISSTPETTSEIKFSEDKKQFLNENVNYIMNPYDEWYSLVRAIELKEQNGGQVILIHVGTAQSDKIIRKGLAIGADEAVRVDAEPASSRFVADQIANYAKEHNVDLVFLGKETLDYNSSEVGAMVAELLDQPFLSYSNKLSYDNGHFNVGLEIEGGVESLEVKSPFVLSAAKGLAEQRIPNMRGIMMAKRKPLTVIEAVDSPQVITIDSYEVPAKKAGVKLVDPENMDELVRLLHEEAKVI